MGLVAISLIDFIVRASRASTEVGIGFLEAFGEYVAEKLKDERYASLQDLYEAHENGDTGLAKLESKPIAMEDGVFVLKECPYREVLMEYKGLRGELPNIFQKITEEYNAAKKAYAPIVSPFCIMHRKVRELYAQKATCGDKRVKLHQIACRSVVDPKKIEVNETNARQYCPDMERLKCVMKLGYCCYAIA